MRFKKFLLTDEKWKWNKDKPSENKRRFYYDVGKRKNGMYEIRYVSSVGPRSTIEKWTGRTFDDPEKAKKVLEKLNRGTDREKKPRV